MPYGRQGGEPVFRTITRDCTHTDQIRDVKPSARGCEECLRMEYFHSTGHPIVQSFEPGENWRWCYVDNVLV